MKDTHPPHPTETIDILIIGAGISGIGAAHHLQEQCPGRSILIVESKDTFGGTWATHTYPGIRSDSDLFTFGYRFRPWTGNPIASAPAILSYLKGAIADDGIDRLIRYRHTVLSAAWSSARRNWRVEIARADEGDVLVVEAKFLWVCAGYYDHAEGYTPDFPGMDSFKGRIVHPQTWPADLDYSCKRIIVIGSGATAATLIPSLAPKAGHVTMLQRSPTYFWSGSNRSQLADLLRKLRLPERWIHAIVRRQMLKLHQILQKAATENPEKARQRLLDLVRKELGPDFDVDRHFAPAYRPWMQRLAFVPDGDLFKAIGSGKVSVVTDQIARLTETGIETKGGETLEADLIITATGFNQTFLAGIPFTVDDAPVHFPDHLAYRGILLSDLPNLAFTFGYLRSSWTLRVDLVCDFVCRMLNTMAARGADVVVPELKGRDLTQTRQPLIPPDNFNPGYMARARHLLPQQGDHEPWTFETDYYKERHILPKAPLDDGVLAMKQADARVSEHSA